MKRTILSLILSATLWLGAMWAGTSLNCVDFASAPGSLFETIKPLSKVAIMSDDSAEDGKYASGRLTELLKAADADPKNLEKQVAAGYLFEALRQVGGRPAAKFHGMSYLHRASELAPQNAEVHLILALAYIPRDMAKAQLHRKRAQELAAKDSPTAKNLEATSRFFGD